MRNLIFVLISALLAPAGVFGQPARSAAKETSTPPPAAKVVVPHSAASLSNRVAPGYSYFTVSFLVRPGLGASLPEVAADEFTYDGDLAADLASGVRPRKEISVTVHCGKTQYNYIENLSIHRGTLDEVLLYFRERSPGGPETSRTIHLLGPAILTVRKQNSPNTDDWNSKVAHTVVDATVRFAYQDAKIEDTTAPAGATGSPGK